MQRNVTAIYRTHQIADLVRTKLQEIGVKAGHISVIPDREDKIADGDTRNVDDYDSELNNLKLGDEETSTYRHAVKNGDYVVSANVDDDNANLDAVQEIMAHPESRNIDELEQGYRDESARDGGDRTHSRAGEGREVIPEVEEELQVGKREREQKSVNVRSYTREEPVEERVELRRERVDVERRDAGDERLTGEDAERAFQDRDLEVEERREEAVVQKEAFKKGEVVVDKDVDHETKTVEDKVRKTEVEVDEAGSGRR